MTYPLIVEEVPPELDGNHTCSEAERFEAIKQIQKDAVRRFCNEVEVEQHKVCKENPKASWIGSLGTAFERVRASIWNEL